MTPTQPNKPDDTQWNIARIVAGHDNNYGQIPEVAILIASLELFEQSRLAPLLAQNAALQKEVDAYRITGMEINSALNKSGAVSGCGEVQQIESLAIQLNEARDEIDRLNKITTERRVLHAQLSVPSDVAALQAQVEAAKGAAYALKQAQDYLTGNSDSNPHALVEDTLTRCIAAGLTAREGT